MNPNNYQTYLNNNGGANPIPAQGSQPNGLEKLLPTIGGIAGGVLGDILPGGPITGVAGAAGGDALGKFLEDKLTGQAGGNGVLTSAIEGGLGQGAGELLAGGAQAVLGAGSKGAGMLADSQVASKVAAQGAKDTADQAAADVTKTQTMTNNYGSINQKLQKLWNLGPNADTVDAMGYDSTNPADMKTVSNAGLELNQVYDRALQKAPNVDISDDVLGPINKAVAAKQPLDTATLPLRQALDEAGVPMDKETLQDLPATQARKVQQAIGRQIGNSQKIVTNAEDQGLRNADEETNLSNLQKIYKSLGAKIKTPEVDKAIANTSVTDEGRAALVSQYGDKLGNSIADTVNGAKSADDLLGPMQDYTHMSQAADMAGSDMQNVVAGPRAVARAKAALPTAETPEAQAEPLIGPNGEALASVAHPRLGAAVKLGNKLGSKIPLAGVSKMLGKAAASKVLPAIAKSGAIAATNIPNDAASAATPGASAIPTTTPQSNMGGTMAPTLDPTQQYYQTLLAQLQAQPADAQTGSILGALNGVVPVAQKQSLAAPILSSLLGSYQNAGGAQGPVAGGLSQASSVIPGSAAATYQGQESTAADTLASLLGITPQAAMQLLPGLMQTQATAASPQAALQRILGSVGGTSSAIPAVQ